MARFADARRIDEAQGNASDAGAFAHKVSGGPRRGGNDGALLIQQPVEQARFAHVGPSHDREAQSLADDAAIFVALDQFLKLASDGVQASEDYRPAGAA